MKLLRRLLNSICVLLMMNLVLLYRLTGEGTFLTGRFFAFGIIFAVIILLFTLTEILPCYERGFQFRLQVLMGGYELIVTTVFCLFAEIAGYVLFFRLHDDLALQDLWSRTADSAAHSLLVTALLNGIMAYLVLLFHYLNGFWRTVFCSSQLGILLRILMLFFWWLPPVNIVLIFKWCAIVRRELIFEKNRYLLDTARKENEICETRYPVVMVHGIFFRDWHYLNYWGRIPQRLKRYGARVFYGHQQSSLSIADSAAELKQEIEQILRETGSEKVNIIAHSKGGLDARYAISRLGLAPFVASLTTVNTPHRGCQFADALLGSLPKGLIRFVAGRYNALFKKLGDRTPDFLAGVTDLTASSCAVFNAETQDNPAVYYQSCMSRMHNVFSAGFPLNLGYLLVKKYEGDNDGLVSVSSAVWGNYLGLLSAGRKGISHGDMIDLTHKNIKGFDVGEFYVQLFAGLKEKGF